VVPPAQGQNYRWDLASASRELFGCFGDDPDLVIQYLHESAAHVERASRSTAKSELTLAKQRHEGGVAGKDSDFPVVRGRDHGIRLALEQHGLRGNHRYLQHRYELESFSALSMTPSMPPCMKNACSGY